MKKKKGFRKIAIDALIQDAINLEVFCRMDKEKLIAARLSWSMYDALQVKIKELLSLNRKLIMCRVDCKYEAACLQKFARECYKLRSELRTTLNYCLELADWERKIPGVSRKKSYADIIQDLIDLALVGEKFMSKSPGYFTDTEMITKARNNSALLSKMVARKAISFNSKAVFQNECLEKCRSLNSIMKTIRTAGKIAFSDNPRRRAAYTIK